MRRVLQGLCREEARHKPWCVVSYKGCTGYGVAGELVDTFPRPFGPVPTTSESADPNAFEIRRQTLVAKFAGKYALFRHGQPFAIYDKWDDAFANGVHHFHEIEGFYIAKIQERRPTRVTRIERSNNVSWDVLLEPDDIRDDGGDMPAFEAMRESLVVAHEGKWALFYAGSNIGVFDSKPEAESAGIKLINKTRKSGTYFVTRIERRPSDAARP